ncbi:NADP-dependent malic enzyme [Algiphilus sp.]|uniref:NADP-dependent malic enzyme n=1 Tax=Algiphilus sp. TaxID=1872431 RepID=UPI003BABCA65
MSEDMRAAALAYHRNPQPGKLEIRALKPMATQADLALAYSPGVAYACEAIAADESATWDYTARGNLVGVITNGTAVLGLGSIGPAASKPVMEGKAVLFKQFAGIDVFDIEIKETEPERLIEIIAPLEPTFGGINLEDIKAPDCFIVERELRSRMNIPVFHDDQHGTAIVVGAAIVNGLTIARKDIRKIKVVTAGAGAAALSCLNMLVSLGLPRENIWVCDVEGLVYEGRTALMDEFKATFAQASPHRTLDDVIKGADVFLGLSAGGVLKPHMVEKMAKRPIIMALANPTPEILPDEARAVRPDAILATGRSDYPNQVNNVLCFPFMFRGALDVGARTINEEMKVACVHAIAELARRSAEERVRNAYSSESLRFGPDYLIPKPFDTRLITVVAPAVAKAAMDSGVASRPIEDFDAYHARLHAFVFRSGMIMRPVFEAARAAPKRVIYAEGHRSRVLMAVQQVVDDGLAQPVLVGRREAIEDGIQSLGLRIRPEADVTIIDPDDPEVLDLLTDDYHRHMARDGVSRDEARAVVKGSQTALAALALKRDMGDAMLCGRVGRFHHHLRHVRQIIGRAPGVSALSALTTLILPQGTYFFCDTHISPEPDPEAIAEMTLLAAEEVRRFGHEPRVALLSYSNFGTRAEGSPRKMRAARDLIRKRAPELNMDGEMHADMALNEDKRHREFPFSTLEGNANLFIMPGLDAANISYQLLKTIGKGIAIGPILIGSARPAHILPQSVSVRGLVNMTAVAVARAQLAATEASKG